MKSRFGVFLISLLMCSIFSERARAQSYCGEFTSYETMLTMFPQLSFAEYYSLCCTTGDRPADCEGNGPGSTPDLCRDYPSSPGCSSNQQPAGETQSDYYECPRGATADGRTVTGKPKQEECGTDLQIYKCLEPGAWVPQGTFCGKDFVCEGGRRCDDKPITGSPDQEVCGTNLQVWKCVRSGYSTGHWQEQEKACVSDAIGLCPLYTETVKVNAPEPKEDPGDTNCGYFFGAWICNCSKNFLGLLICEGNPEQPTCSETIGGAYCQFGPGECINEGEERVCCPGVKGKWSMSCNLTKERGMQFDEVMGGAVAPNPVKLLTMIGGAAGLQAAASRVYSFLSAPPYGPGHALTNAFYRLIPRISQGDVTRMLERIAACASNNACIERVIREFTGM